MDEEIGETSVKAETMNVAAHLRFIDPAHGLVNGPLQVSIITYSSLGSLDHHLNPMSPSGD
jgi:hypothetical protein